MPLHDPTRHEPLVEIAWDEARVRDAIAATCLDAERAWDDRLAFPLHPSDEEPGSPVDGVARGLHFGAAGVLHGLARLADAGVHEPTLDGARAVLGLHDASLAAPDEPGAGPSLLVGSTGILLVEHRLAPSAAAVDALAAAIEENVEHPANEVLLGAPGTMLAARAMHARTGEERFAELWRRSTRVLVARREADGLWTQDIYGSQVRYIGAAHGFAGCVRALLDAPEWLDDPADVTASAAAALERLAVEEDGKANWAPLDDREPGRAQWCHGAAGIVTSLVDLAPGDDRVEALLVAGGELVWSAGPMRSASLCHGTAGNGFAFLSLLARTGDERWLARARAFAMHALAQVEATRAADGRGRYSLGSGDIGAALLAASCLGVDARFPWMDDL